MNPKPIVHIATDEKFINAAYDIYEQAFPGQNLFIVLLNNRETKLRYVSKTKDYEYVFLDGNYIEDVISKTAETRFMIFHGMNIYQAKIALSRGIQCKLIWTVFGSEVYNNPKIIGKNKFGVKTFKKFIGNKFLIKNKFRSAFYKLLKGSEDPFKVVLKAIRKMDYVSILYKEEFELFRRLNLLKEKAGWLKFTYYPLNLIVDKDSAFINENNILLGNSASYTNNHLEAFDLLRTFKIGDQKIITPLSYGNKTYARDIEKIGKEIFPDNFYPLTEFMPLAEYQKLTQSCGIVIMNHYRQQAVGNVVDMMYRGAKIYLSEKNTLYHYLKRIGCHLYDIENSQKIENDPLRLLENIKMKENRSILEQELRLENICLAIQQKLKLK